MKTTLVPGLALLLAAGPALALDVEAYIDGPLLKRERVIEFVGKRIGGAVARMPGLEEGGRHRLFVRVISEHTGPGSRFSSLVDIELQRQVIEQDTGNIYWAMLRSGTAWGSVPSETELWQWIADLIEQKVNLWPAH